MVMAGASWRRWENRSPRLGAGASQQQGVGGFKPQLRALGSNPSSSIHGARNPDFLLVGLREEQALKE